MKGDENIYKQILKKYWGYNEFRPLQEDIVRSVIEGCDTLGLMPTGGGKSITFQVPALALEGICLVVTPLIALMKDQVENLQKRGIKAHSIHSGLTYSEIQTALENCIHGGYKFLYLSPERLSTELFLSKLSHLKVNIVAVDEAHCISQWGYDFRPSYLKIAELRELLPGVPVLALTATATPRVIDDIQEQLGFKKKNVFHKSFERSNLAYVIRASENKGEQLVKILDSVQGSALVYARNREKTREYAELLTRGGIAANFFHAGLPRKIKDERQQQWKSNHCRVMVCTNAFGMGIDKPDVRVVVHVDAPDSLEAYFQEAGRAGRDGQKAYAVLLWSAADKMVLNRGVSVTFPETDVIKRVYDAIGNFFQVAVGSGCNETFDFNMGRFCAAYGFSALTVFSSLKILQRAGYLVFSEEMNIPSKIKVLFDSLELYKFQVANATLDPVIKILLRSYTGLFTEYAPVDEELIAKRLECSRDEAYRYLLALGRQKVIHYIPRRDTPVITFLQRREEIRHLVFIPGVYQELKERYRERVDAVIDYISTNHVCRSKLLLRYFGQNTDSDCGHCDACINLKKRDLPGSEFIEIQQMIKSRLIKSPLPANELVQMPGISSDKVWKVVTWLEDAGLIGENQDGSLQWFNK